MPEENQRSVQLTEQDDGAADDLREILAGLRNTKKSISPKFFYDERGSKLFDQICELPEYYLTRTELDIMRHNIQDIVGTIGPQASLIEFGSGASLKIRLLLENLEQLAAYVPVDISGEFLVNAASSVQQDFPDVEVLPVRADFTHPFDLPEPKVMPIRNVVYFPGSTIGNFSPQAAEDLLRVMHQEAGNNGALLIGIDRQKDTVVLKNAYNDSAGITAEFNLNVLHRINRDFSGNFNTAKFRHRAVYNEDVGRIEMYLDSDCDQVAIVGGEKFSFTKDEEILTEHSHKYTLEGFSTMANGVGFRIERIWSDPKEWFSILYCATV